MNFVSRDFSERQIAALVEPDRVHRSVYADPEIFEAERRRLFGRAWLFVGHESQIKNPGDYYCTRLAGQPVIMVRHGDGTIRVLHNRCAHRGAAVCTQESGHAKDFRCAYHGWTFRTDGSLLNLPVREGYAQGYDLNDPAYGLKVVPRVESYRGFVFASLAAEGPTLKAFLGDLTSSFDDMTDRAPDGEIEVAGGIFKHYYDGNWKLYIENVNDLMHPRYVHESSIDSASRQPKETWTDGAGEIAVRQMMQNGVLASIWDKVNVWTFDHGHSFMGDYHDDSRLVAGLDNPVWREYRAALEARHGAERTRQILNVSRFNTIIYPNLTFISQFRQLRVIHPISPARTEVHVFSFRLKGEPDSMFRDTVRFANAINSPASAILTDDLEVYRRIRDGMTNEESEWLFLGRGAGRDVADNEMGGLRGDHGTSEIHIRNQFKAWLGYMSQPA
jgi:phenylpropionate dioxygenase-like ring-hydroxylating dioxygenase large terminal subunit